LFFKNSPGDPASSSAEDFASLATALGLPGLIYGWTLLLLPQDFFLAEQAGRQVLAFVGLRSPSGIRIFAGSLCLISIFLIVFGLYGLFS
jgi:hypothetical protein